MEQKWNEPILSVEGLSVGFRTKTGSFEPVTKALSFSIKPGELIGLVGESGSGKSVTALAIMGLLGEDAKILSGSIRFLGKELTNCPNVEYCKLRGSELAMVFQEPMSSLNPVLTVGMQAEEMLLVHGIGKNSAERKSKVLEMFEKTGLNEGEALYGKYPYQLSGGMRQRVMIATAMLCHPKLLIADEPTTALDVTLQAKILELIQSLNQEFGTAVLFISHDLGVVRRLCKRAFVLYQGSCVEQGTVQKLFTMPEQEYTRQLLSASTGKDYCMERKSLVRTEPLLQIQKLSVYYQNKTKAQRHKQAVNQISFELYRGETLGIVGESGSGKSSLAKAIAGLQKDWEGNISYFGSELRLQPRMVFQDPYGSLNPSKTLGWLLEEPLRMQQKRRVFSGRNKKLWKERAEDMLEKTGLSAEFYARYPRALSGGQRQRAAIAMALMTHPELLILDEPVSALDVTIQEQILELLSYLREEFHLTYLFISHDLSVVRRFCDRICVMHEGKIVECADTQKLFTEPENDYTKQLLASILS